MRPSSAFCTSVSGEFISLELPEASGICERSARAMGALRLAGAPLLLGCTAGGMRFGREAGTRACCPGAGIVRAGNIVMMANLKGLSSVSPC